MKDIIIKNAYHGNLKNLDLTIPRNKLVVITGLSRMSATVFRSNFISRN